MRWIRIRKAKIDPELRETFERYGEATMQTLLATTNYFVHKGKEITAMQARSDLLPWLTEQYDRAERKETWLLTMEVAITIFVVLEGVITLLAYSQSAALRQQGRRVQESTAKLQSAANPASLDVEQCSSKPPVYSRLAPGITSPATTMQN